MMLLGDCTDRAYGATRRTAYPRRRFFYLQVVSPLSSYTFATPCPVWTYTVPRGTDSGCAATRIAVSRPVRGPNDQRGVYAAGSSSPRVCDGMSGTGIGYAQPSVLRARYGVSGTDIGYG
eukprot:667933-Rhodomonas_salina.2